MKIDKELIYKVYRFNFSSYWETKAIAMYTYHSHEWLIDNPIFNTSYTDYKFYVRLFDWLVLIFLTIVVMYQN